jgi:hypothetical protein
VEDVEPNQGRLADNRTAEQELPNGFADDWNRSGNVGSDGDRPERQLIPWQQVAGETEKQRQNEQGDPEDPVEGTRRAKDLPRLVGAGEKDPKHVEEDQRHHEVSRDPVQPSQEPPETHRMVEVLDAPIGTGRR